MESLSILLVEDDKLINRAWTLGLSQSGYEVISADTFKVAQELLRSRKFDAAIVDVNLHDGNGLDLLRWIKMERLTLKTLIVTARQDQDAAVLALQRGATEFIRKPVGPVELVTRLDRMFRFANEEPVPYLHFKDLSLNEKTREVFCRGLSLRFSPSEYLIFRLLIKHAGSPVAREQLLGVLSLGDAVSDRTVDSHISRIRRKLKDGAGQSYIIESVWANGYALKFNPVEP